MKPYLVRATWLLVLPTLGLAFVLGFVPGRAELVARVYALVVAAVILGLAIAALRRAYARETPLLPPAPQRQERREIPETLARLEQEVVLATANSFDLHVRLRSRLRVLAAERLAARHAIDLDREPELARRVLGDETFDLVRVDRPPPVDRLARGMAIKDLDRVVESLERV